jgi:thymidylate synthase (FAD)
MFELRRQDTKNRQNSIDDIDEETKIQFEEIIKSHYEKANSIYKLMIEE